MNLSRVERWILSNQFKILERLNPGEADYYRRASEALEWGFTREYRQLAQHVSERKIASQRKPVEKSSRSSSCSAT